MRPVSSWGRLSALPHRVISVTEPHQLSAQMMQAPHPGLAYGAGRSYGDVCLNPGHTLWDLSGLDRFVAFDPATGRLVCEAGVLLRDIQSTLMPRGWALPVTPGTQMVTVGGAIANDVHGKNHHVCGSFGNHVRTLTLVRTDGQVVVCGPDQEAALFRATVGGLGLTGVIAQAELQLRPVSSTWLDVETLAYQNLDEFFQLADESEAQWEYTVSWVDCLSQSQGSTRGIFMRANHCTPNLMTTGKERPGEANTAPYATGQRRLGVPMVPPFSLVNRWSLRAFNMAYYHLKKSRAGMQRMHYEPFFYPLDGLAHWNRMYGPKGFFQYQSVVPRSAGPQATQAMLQEIGRSGSGSFLAVLKTFGTPQSLGMLSFPQAGVTLALDFSNAGAGTHRLFERLDAIVREAGGRIYMAKDARMPRALFEAGYGAELSEFLHHRDAGISSALAHRLMRY